MYKRQTLELAYGPSITLGRALNYAEGRNVWIDCDYTITQEEDIVTDQETLSGIVATEYTGSTRLGIDDFNISSDTFDGIEFAMADYKPEDTAEKHPLIIWLHGGGEDVYKRQIIKFWNIISKRKRISLLYVKIWNRAKMSQDLALSE